MATNVAAGKVGTPLITLTANTEEVISFADNIARVDIVNAGATADLWASVDGSQAAVGGANCYYVPAGSVLTVGTVNAPSDQVRLISSGAPTVRVQRSDS